MYAIMVNIEETVRGWTSSRGVPTFYLNECAHGIVSEAHASEIAADVVDPFRRLRDSGCILHVTAVKV